VKKKKKKSERKWRKIFEEEKPLHLCIHLVENADSSFPHEVKTSLFQ